MNNEKDKVSNPETSLRIKTDLLATVSNNGMVGKMICKRNCGDCFKNISDLETNVSWQILEFCNERCLEMYQKRSGSNCTFCGATVDFICLGKYCERFGYEIRQFCGNKCLQEYKKTGKWCSCCHKNISDTDDAFLAPVGQAEHFKHFCSIYCMERYETMRGNQPPRKPGDVCMMCDKDNITVEFEHENQTKLFCGDLCFSTFKFVNDIVTDKCGFCQQHFDINTLNKNSMYYENVVHVFCSEGCKITYVAVSAKLVSCNQCKIKKYVFEMIKRKIVAGEELIFCSLNCSSIHQERMKCGYCQKKLQQLNVDTDNAIVAMFCSHSCLMSYQNQHPTPLAIVNQSDEPSTSDPIEVKNLARQPENPLARSSTSGNNSFEVPNMGRVDPCRRILEYIKSMPPQRNAATMCKVTGHNKSVDCKPITVDKATQTDEMEKKSFILPIPVPIYVPLPMRNFSFPVPFPFPLPIPVPIFVPTKSKTISNIMRNIQDIKKKFPTNPLEAELIAMAEMVADNTQTETSYETRISEEENSEPDAERFPIPEFDDVPQKELGPPKPVLEALEDLENFISPSTLRGRKEEFKGATDNDNSVHQPMQIQAFTGSKRPGDSPNVANKKQKQEIVKEMEATATTSQLPQNQSDGQIDPQISLKYMIGINVWNHWIVVTNAQLGTSSPVKPFKNDILQLTVKELNHALCLFIKDVRKPNGSDYSPDTIYYMCLCIQKYLFENGRMDSIFYDSYYEKFTECVDEIAKKFSMLYNDSDCIVTRVREEHLWESKQLGAHCPYILLNTIMYFTTKYFKLGTIDDHIQLSFLEVMKLWKHKFKQSVTNKVAAPTSMIPLNKDSLMNPIKLYEFYLSKCPEGVKTRNDVFYLLPERHCTLDSPVWFSTIPLSHNNLQKMLHRIKFVKEINIALV